VLVCSVICLVYRAQSQVRQAGSLQMSNSNHRVRLAHPVSLLDVVNLRSDPIPVLIRRLALPASIGMVFSVLLNVTDTFYAGMLSSTALAALSLAGPVFFLVMTLGIGIGQATNALVGNRLGSDDLEGARGMAMQSISFAVIVSVLAAAVTLWATPWLFALMGGEGARCQWRRSCHDLCAGRGGCMVVIEGVTARFSAGGQVGRVCAQHQALCRDRPTECAELGVYAAGGCRQLDYRRLCCALW